MRPQELGKSLVIREYSSCSSIGLLRKAAAPAASASWVSKESDRPLVRMTAIFRVAGSSFNFFWVSRPSYEIIR